MEKKIVQTLLAVDSVWSLGVGLFFPIFAIFSSQVGGDITDAGTAAAIFIFVTSILEYPIGKLLDHFHEKYFLVFDYLIEGIVFIGYIFVDSIYELFILQILLGIANAFGDPAWESMYDKSTPINKSGSAWANAHFFVGIFNAIGIILGSYIVSIYGFSSVFFIGAVLSFLASGLAAYYIKKV